MELPNLGKNGSILSILVPGTFLLCNIIVGFYFILWNKTLPFEKISDNLLEIIAFLLLICVAYLLGAILRLMKCDIPDNISGWYLKNIERRKGIKEFPYIDWIRLKCGYEYREAKEFYKLLWANYKPDKQKKTQTDEAIENQNSGNNRLIKFFKNVKSKVKLFFKRGKSNQKNKKYSRKKGKSFLNFYKVVLISVDENLANECYAAEAFTRYLSSIFYGLFCSFVIIILVLIKQYFFSNDQLSLTLLVIEGFYAVAMFFILRNYRYIRIKEVETVFAATFAAKEEILKLLGKELSEESRQNSSTTDSIDSAER